MEQETLQENKEEKDLFQFHTSANLKKHWEKFSLKYMKKVNRDRVIIVDGSEGVGKSQWTIQQAYNLDPEMFKDVETFLSRIAFTPDEFFSIIRNVKNGVVIFDEAFRGFSSRSALSKINKQLVQGLMEMRQQNNIVFIVLPSFFLLDIYPAMLRSNTLFNIYFSKGTQRRAWRGYNKQDKNEIYQKGVKKGWFYSKNSLFKGYFYGKFPGGEKYEKAYLDKKYKAFKDSHVEEDKSRNIKLADNESLKLIYGRYKELNSYRKLEEWCKSVGLPISHNVLRQKITEYLRQTSINTIKT